MNSIHKPSFFEGVAVAFVASIVIAACTFVFARIFVSTGMLQILVTLLSAAYIAYLMVRSHERLGRLTVFSIWFVLTFLGMILSPSLLVFVLLQLGMIWIIRSLYYYNSVLAALADLGLMGLSTFVALWAWLNTQSLFLAMWCFFLMQALFVLIPKQLKTSNSTESKKQSVGDRFEHAYLAAEQAVRQLTLNQPKS